MKLCIVTRFFPKDYYGGGESVIYNIWKRAAVRYEVSLISGWTKDPALLPADSYKVDLTSKNRFLRYIRLFSAVKRFVKEIKPDIIHTNTMEIPETGIPTIVMVHHVSHFLDIVNIQNSFFARLRLRIQRNLVVSRLNRARFIVTVSNATKEDLIRLGIDQEKIRVIHNGIDFERFDSIKKNIGSSRLKNEKGKPQKERKVQNDKDSRFTIAYPSRISPEKAQHIAINAIKLLPKELLDKVNLVLPGFVSDENYLKELQSLIQGYPVEILPNVDNIEQYYFLADLIIFPTLLKEGFGLVAAEALACSKPIIASDMPAIREVVNEYGMLIEPNNPARLANAMIEVFKDKKKYAALANKGNIYVRKNFSWETAFGKYEELYGEIAKH
ncbi:glycosyltransferase family 4 protein [Candidatus Woesearchaeota archaeon]|nr:glycosyltransferase family 4 protein [Candidatus Woesearchaeota archaeon]